MKSRWVTKEAKYLANEQHIKRLQGYAKIWLAKRELTRLRKEKAARTFILYVSSAMLRDCE